MWDGVGRVMRAIRKSPEVKEIEKAVGPAHYLMKPPELLARAYTQYIVRKSGDPGLIAELVILKFASTLTVEVNKQWSDENFLPIEIAFERLFKGLKWQKGS